MKELFQQVNNLEKDVDKLKSLQDGGGGGGTVTAVTGTSPIASSGGTTPAISLNNSTVTPGSYTNTNLTVDAHGLITAASSGSAGGVTSVTGTAPIASSGGATPDISLNNSGVSAGTYTNATVQVSAKGLVTSASSGTAPVTSVGVTAPVTSTGGTTPTIGLSVTPANPGGAVALQAAYPGTTQTGSAHVNGTLGADTRINLNAIPMLERGSSFPASPTDGQQYFHTTYRSWFVYINADSLWRQQSPGVFSGSFPTVSSGDNTAAPKIQVTRVDRNDITYFWNGSDWLGPQHIGTLPIFPGTASNAITVNTNNLWFDVHPDGASDVYIESLFTPVLINSNNNGNNATNYWNFTYRFRNSALGVAVTGSANTSTFSALALTQLTLLANTKVTRANFYDVLIDVAKAGTTANPGTLFIDPFKIIFRLVG